MARIRSIKPEFFCDPKIGRLSIAARLLYIAIWTECDDAGNCPADPRRLAAVAFPYDATIDVVPLLDELITLGRVVRYRYHDEDYIHVPRFAAHQHIRDSRPFVKYPTFREELVLHAETRATHGEARALHAEILQDRDRVPDRDPIRKTSSSLSGSRPTVVTDRPESPPASEQTGPATDPGRAVAYLAPPATQTAMTAWDSGSALATRQIASERRSVAVFPDAHGGGGLRAAFDPTDPAVLVLTTLCKITGRKFLPVPATLAPIRARLAEGATPAQCIAVIVNQWRQWRGGEYEKYCRPSTLFRPSKFAEYIAEAMVYENRQKGG